MSPFFVVLLQVVCAASAMNLHPGCTESPIQFRIQKQGKWRESLTEPGYRYISSNHKTGTYFASCLCDSVDVNCSLAAVHTAGGGLIDTHWCVNMVRNPFNIIHSGYEYHRGLDTNHTLEKWAIRPAEKETVAKDVGAYFSFRTYEKWCRNDKTALPPTANLTYNEALNALPLRDGLALETFRAMYRDFPFMLAAATRCVDVEEKAKTATPRMGGCKNLLLDDVMSNYTESFFRDIVPAFHLEGDQALAAKKFSSECDPAAIHTGGPAATHTAKKQKKHSTKKGEVRRRAIALLRRMDLRLFNGTLHRVEQVLLDAVRGVPQPV